GVSLFRDPSSAEIYTLSLHDALPISLWGSIGFHWAFQTVMGLLGLGRLIVLRIPREGLESAGVMLWFFAIVLGGVVALVGLVRRSEEHTSELQSRENLVCRLLLEKKK